MTSDVETVELPLTQQILGFFNLFEQCRGFGRAVVGGMSPQTMVFPVGRRFEFLPDWVLRELAYATPAEIHFSAITHSQDAQSLLDLAVVWTEITLPLVLSEGELRMDLALRGSTWDKLQTLLPAPTFLLESRTFWVVVWALDRPLQVDLPAERDRAERVQKALAQRLGGRTDEVPLLRSSSAIGTAEQYQTIVACSPARAALPLPGSVDRRDGGGLVTALVLDPDRRSSFDAVEALLQQEAPT